MIDEQIKQLVKLYFQGYSVKDILEQIKSVRKSLKQLRKTVIRMDKYRQALEEVLMNLRCIQAPNAGDEYIDDSIRIIMEVLEEK